MSLLDWGYTQEQLENLGIDPGDTLDDEMRWYCTICQESDYGIPPYFEDRYHFCLRCRRITHLAIVFIEECKCTPIEKCDLHQFDED